MSNTNSSLPPYDYLYRVLREDEHYHDGIKAKSPNASFSVFDHVDKGSYLETQYISTCATLCAAKDFARKGYQYQQGMPREIVKIKTNNLPTGTKFIDLTDSDVRQKYFEERSKPDNFARKFEEVLVIGKIPAESIKLISILQLGTDHE